MAAVQSLDSAYHTARADLLAEWPTALESPSLQDELPKLQGRTCYDHHRSRTAMSAWRLQHGAVLGVQIA